MKIRLPDITTYKTSWFLLISFSIAILSGIIILTIVAYNKNTSTPEGSINDNYADSIEAISTMRPQILDWAQDAKILGCESMFLTSRIENREDGEYFIGATQFNGSFPVWSCEVYSSERVQTRTVIWDNNEITLSSPIKIDDKFKGNYDMLYPFNDIDLKPSSNLVYEKLQNDIVKGEYIEMRIGGSVVNKFKERYVWEIEIKKESDSSTARIIYMDADSLEIL